MNENDDLFMINGFNYMGLKKYKEELENQLLDQEAIEEEINQFLKGPGWTLVPENISNETNDTRDSNERGIFRVLIRRRGRPSVKNSDTFHGSDSFDNIQRKIQVHFQTFLIDFCNEWLKREYKYSSYSFKQINKKNKITVNFIYVSKLKKSSIKDLLNMEISDKYKTFDKNENKELLSKLEGTWLDRLFEMNYLELFKYYHNNGKPLNKMVFENKEIILSSKTKSFYYLLEKYKNLRQKIIETAKSVYLSDFDSCGNPFSTETIP